MLGLGARSLVMIVFVGNMYGLLPCFVPKFNMLQDIFAPQSLDYASPRIHNTISFSMLSSTPLILETCGFGVSTNLGSGCLGIKQAFCLTLHSV